MSVSSNAVSDIEWWINHIEQAVKPIHREKPCLTLQSDASNIGRGGAYKDQVTGANWTVEEKEEHINVLELRAALFTLQSFCGKYHDCHIRLQLDNTTAVTYVNNMGGGERNTAMQ